ncbi:D-isomer specific 2-hydroxyacid dehydrogenase [Apiospora aurea]|uniref:D-isomer specific 2-hydroxyacid dehydrogenase n=1 Tax=Apiospora aurea TaxID=335848 RepID=A0ABR1QFB9_9PEZI
MYIRDILDSSSGGEGGGTTSSGDAAASNTSTNKRLDGHQLLVLTDAARFPELQPGSAWRRRVAQAHPGLKIVVHDQDTWRDRTFPQDLDWAHTTLLLTGAVFPSPDVAPRLEYIQLQSAGADPINQTPIFKETDVAVCTTNGVHGPQIAEWVIGTFLALNHQLPYFLDLQRQGKWHQGWPYKDGMQDGVKQRVGILGYGSIGRQVARIAKALAMDVVAYTNHPRPTPESRRDTGYIVPGTGDPDGEFPAEWYSGTDDADIDAFLGSGLDWLVIAVPLTESTRGLISEARLKLLSSVKDSQTPLGQAVVKPFVTNIARGPILDTDALMKALDAGWIRGAAVDVTDPEPLPEGHPLWAKKNLIITPHISAMSNSLGHRIADVLELNLQRFSEGKKLVNQVSRKEGY